MLVVTGMLRNYEACCFPDIETLIYLFLAGLSLKEFVGLQTVARPP